MKTLGIDPRVHRCVCGLSWKPTTFHKIVMLVRGGYSRKCPQCGTVMRFRFIGHVVKVEQTEVKGKSDLWRRA